MTNNNTRISPLEAAAFIASAQGIARRDDRWTVANAYFQTEQAKVGRSSAAILANDWAAFGYTDFTLEGYLNREVEAQKAARTHN